MRDSPHSVESADIRYYVGVARRRSWIILSLAALLPAVSWLVASNQVPVYAASSEVLVKWENLAAGLTGTQLPSIDGATVERLMETQVELARVPPLVTRVIGVAGAGAQTPEEFLRSSSVEAKPKADILVLTVESSTPAEAVQLANTYADEFSQYRRRLDRTELDAVAGEVRRQLASMETPEGRQMPLRADLEGKLQQIQTLQALQTASALVVRTADDAPRTKPKPLSTAAGGLVLGVILGVGVAFLVETLDSRVRTSGEVVDRLGLPLLGRAPPPPRNVPEDSSLVTLPTPGTEDLEPFSLLRASLTLANHHPAAQVIMVTSAAAQEGKSTTVANLAAALARTGRRVALVDLDLRRPTIHRLFGIRRTPGVVDVATGSALLVDAVVEVAVPSPFPVGGPGGWRPGRPSSLSTLQILPAGTDELSVDVASFMTAVDQLRSRADLVLVDAAPLPLAGDALALGAEMDALVVVARVNKVRRPELDELRRVLSGVPVRILGVICAGERIQRGRDGRSHRGFRRRASEETAPASVSTERTGSRDRALAVAQRSPSSPPPGGSPPLDG